MNSTGSVVKESSFTDILVNVINNGLMRGEDVSEYEKVRGSSKIVSVYLDELKSKLRFTDVVDTEDNVCELTADYKLVGLSVNGDGKEEDIEISGRGYYTLERECEINRVNEVVHSLRKEKSKGNAIIVNPTGNIRFYVNNSIGNHMDIVNKINDSNSKKRKELLDSGSSLKKELDKQSIGILRRVNKEKESRAVKVNQKVNVRIKEVENLGYKVEVKNLGRDIEGNDINMYKVILDKDSLIVVLPHCSYLIKKVSRYGVVVNDKELIYHIYNHNFKGNSERINNLKVSDDVKNVCRLLLKSTKLR